MKTLTKILLLAVTTVVMVLVSCSKRQTTVDLHSGSADSLIFDAGAVKDYARMLQLTDSLEQAGEITAMQANRWRGVAYYRQGQYRPAEVYYKKVMAGKISSEEDQLSYIKSARRLSELLLVKGDYEGSLQVALPAVEQMRQSGYGSDIDFAILLNNIGCCQLNLGRGAEAKESFATARQHYINRWSTDSTGRGFQEAVIGTVYTSQAYINTRRYDESLYWIDRTEWLLNMYRERPDARTEYFDEYQGRIEIMRAVALQALDRKDEAAQAYKRFLTSQYAKTSAGKIYSNDYLVAAKRYGEAADNYQHLDKMLSDWGMNLTLDNIQLYMLPKLRANVGAGRRDSVMAFSLRLCDDIDSAMVNQKNDDTAELATIYETQEKDARLAQQEAEQAHERLVSSLIALALVIIFFSVFIFLRHRSAKRLAHAHQRLEDAHDKLQHAYDKLEETTAAKERIESELRIARDIQMSMVPHLFPQREGLDIYASMTAAKEVGGDLYGYLLEDDLLYFCIGDVSGKGVPASLFMAQASRLFRILATQKMKPADIATRMNAELTEDNEQGMFVTMFLGVVNLKTYHLDYCNCGHNPPLLLGKLADGTLVNMGGMYLEMEPNAPVGLWPGLEYVGESIDSIKNLPLFIYTDGLTEAENKKHEQFGEERLLDIFRTKFFNNSKEVNDYMLQQVAEFRNGAEPNDDLTMLILRAY